MTLAAVKTDARLPEWLRSSKESWEETPEWFQQRQQHAWSHVLAQGLPSSQLENWSALKMQDWWQLPLEAPTGEAASVTFQPWKDALPLVFVNGHYRAELSATDVPKGLTILPLGPALKSHGDALKTTLQQPLPSQDSFLQDVNFACLQDGIVIQVAPGAALTQPLQIVHLQNETCNTHHQVRIVIQGGAQSELSVIHHFSSDDVSLWNNTIVDVALDEGAHLSYVLDQAEGEHAVHTSQLRARLERDSVLRTFTLDTGSVLARHQLEIDLVGSGAECRCNGLYLGRRTQQIDHRLQIVHEQDHGTSYQHYRGILGDQARGLFSGLVTVEKGATKNQADQINKNLLLSREASADPRPQLEIHNDDVICSHGATVGQLDPMSVFYLQSRGIAPEAAQQMLVGAFAEQLLAEVPGGTLQSYVAECLPERLTNFLTGDAS